MNPGPEPDKDENEREQEINKKYKKMVLVTYDTKRKKFDSLYTRNKFYRRLFGYKQKVRKNNKYYEYEKEGLIDEIPCLRIEDSVFLLPQEKFAIIEKYLKKWEEKVEYQTFKILLKKSKWDKLIKEKRRSEQNE